ncbi:helix-turn-helix domain-containing protein [Bacillus inaquosorum]
MNIDKNQVRRWINQFQAEGMKELEEKRGKAKGTATGYWLVNPFTAFK